jgi:hypothetical protein
LLGNVKNENKKEFKMNRITQLTVASVILAVSLAFCQIYHHDVNLATTSPWAENSWHQIGPNCTVEDGTLLIGDNVLVEFYEDQSINVLAGGIIDATDEGGNPIVFTSLNSVEEPGYWKALIADGSSYPNNATINLFNCEIRYGGEAEGNPYFASGVIQCLRYANANVCQCYIHHNSGAGVCLRPIDGSMTPLPNLLVDSCRFEYCDIGVKVINGDLITHQVDVKRNWIEDCTIGMKLWAQAWDNNIKNNIIRRSASYGIYAFPNSPSGCRIGAFWNNVIDGDGVSLDGIYTEDRIWYQGIVNNLIMNNTGYGIYNESEGDAIDVYNCCFYANQSGSTNWAGHLWDCIEDQDPRLVSAYGDDGFYHLLWDSPCLGTGDDEMSNSNPAISCSMP